MAGYGIGSRADTVEWTADAALMISPYPVTPATAIVTISGTLTNFSNVTGCTIGSSWAYVERLE